MSDSADLPATAAVAATSRRYSFGEEVANAVTHGVGALLSVAALVLLVVLSVAAGDGWHIAGATVFGSSLLLAYVTSTLYHSLPGERAKAFLRKLDHGAIFILIAGTYTPFCLGPLRGPWGWSLFGVIWALAAAGVALKLRFTGRFPGVSTVLYIAMGWLIVLAIRPMIERVPPGALGFLLAGGIVYTAGTIFYLCRKLPYQHAVWHLFVVGGSVCHFFAVLRAVS